jgi:general secretion pathway protein A
MYQAHWNLKGRPFENGIDETMYYPAEGHQTVLLKLRYALENRRSVTLMCGESGIGKSFVLELLARQLPENFRPIIHLRYPDLPSEQLLQWIADEVTGTGSAETPTVYQSLRRIEKFLRDSQEEQRHPVVMIDEAHLLDAPSMLETLRLLVNLHLPRPGEESAWSLVLAGQPTLLGNVERCRALEDRASVKCIIPRMSLDQTAAYLSHRLRIVGGHADQIFSNGAIEQLHARGSGIPRRINRLADLALMVGYAEDLARIEPAQIEGVHEELLAVQ